MVPEIIRPIKNPVKNFFSEVLSHFNPTDEKEVLSIFKKMAVTVKAMIIPRIPYAYLSYCGGKMNLIKDSRPRIMVNEIQLRIALIITVIFLLM